MRTTETWSVQRITDLETRHRLMLKLLHAMAKLSLCSQYYRGNAMIIVSNRLKELYSK